MYPVALRPITSKPAAKRREKSRFKAISGSITPTAFMLARKLLSIQSASMILNSAMSDNQRKFAGPVSIQYKGTRIQTKIV